jgi:ribonuclease P protein component
MFPKKERVTKNAFRVLIKERKTISTPLFLFYYQKSDLPKYAFVSPKKAFKNAVERNKYRRIGYEILSTLGVKSGSGIFMYKKQVTMTTKEEIKKDISFILKKAGIV